MIDPEFVRMMARYNSWQNSSIFQAAETLSPEALETNRGAFFGSIRQTLSHLLWGDTIWMSRFDGWAPPDVGIPGSADWQTDFAAIADLRRNADDRILGWAERIKASDLVGPLKWHSGALGRDVEKPVAICIMHFFNHQTHHRGQVHAMVTAAGAHPGDTDLFILPEAI